MDDVPEWCDKFLSTWQEHGPEVEICIDGSIKSETPGRMSIEHPDDEDMIVIDDEASAISILSQANAYAERTTKHVEKAILLSNAYWRV